MKIQSLAALKRAITPNVVITVIAHWQPQLVGTTRTPTKIQGNGYFFNGPDSKGQISRMWAGTPKASQLRFNEDGSVTYHPDTERSWTLRFDEAQGHSHYCPDCKLYWRHDAEHTRECRRDLHKRCPNHS